MSTEIATPAMFIEDGFTLPFVIPEVPGVSAEINGEYRPFTAMEKQKLSNDWARFHEDAEKSDKATCEAIAKHLVSWNVVNRKGESVLINAANISKLHPSSLLSKLLDTVTDLGHNQATEAKAAVIVRDRSLDNDGKVEAFRKMLDEAGKPADKEGVALKN